MGLEGKIKRTLTNFDKEVCRIELHQTGVYMLWRTSVNALYLKVNKMFRLCVRSVLILTGFNQCWIRIKSLPWKFTASRVSRRFNYATSDLYFCFELQFCFIACADGREKGVFDSFHCVKVFFFLEIIPVTWVEARNCQLSR